LKTPINEDKFDLLISKTNANKLINEEAKK
jgi:hypothetical protein